MKLVAAKPKKKQTAMFVIIGPEFTYKTGTCLEAPGWTHLIALDKKYTSAVNRAIKQFDAKINVEKISLPAGTFSFNPNAAQVYQMSKQEFRGKECVEAWLHYKRSLHEALHHPDVANIVIDPGKKVQNLCRLSHFHKLTQVMPRDYGRPNAEFELVHEQCQYDQDHGKNVFMIHHTDEEKRRFKNAKGEDDFERTGKMVMDGDKRLLQMACVVVWAEKAPPPVKGGRDQVIWTVTKSEPNPEAQGQKLRLLDEDGEESGELSFEYLSSLVFP